MGTKKSEHTGDSHGICPSCWDVHHSDFGPYPEEKPQENPQPNDNVEKAKAALENRFSELEKEGFDPQSQGGPNVESTEGTSKYNPYPEMLSKMKKTERGEDEEVNAVFDELMNEDVEDEEINLSELLTKLKNEDQESTASRPNENPLDLEGVHGREAQLAGAGEFDPRTFGVNPEPTDEMYLTKPTYLRKGKLKEEGNNFRMKYTKHPKKPTQSFEEVAGAPAPPAMGQGSGDSLAMPDDDGHFDTELPIGGEEKYKKQLPGGQMGAVNISEEDVSDVIKTLKSKKKSPLRECVVKMKSLLGYGR
jgi:hypothetical protein